MEQGELCAVVHVDIGMRTGLEVVEDALHALADGSSETPGTLGVTALRLEGKPNHFEVIGRFASEAAYHDHLVGASNLAFRAMVAPVLGSPYEDRLHAARGNQSWPSAGIDDFVVVTQIEARPSELDGALAAFDEFVAEQSSAVGLRGQVALQRRQLANNLEVVSVWTDADAFESYLASEQASSRQRVLEATLLAPVDNRRYSLIAGGWSQP
jgi:quinol monooxygenase YgiN